jgi:hypothetical protein
MLSFGLSLTTISKASEGGCDVDVEHVERVESELDQLIERRAQQRKDADEEHELWKASVAKYNGKRRQQNRKAWYAFHLSQAEAVERTAASIAADHRARAEALLEEPGEGMPS